MFAFFEDFLNFVPQKDCLYIFQHVVYEELSINDEAENIEVDCYTSSHFFDDNPATQRAWPRYAYELTDIPRYDQDIRRGAGATPYFVQINF